MPWASQKAIVLRGGRISVPADLADLATGGVRSRWRLSDDSPSKPTEQCLSHITFLEGMWIRDRMNTGAAWVIRIDFMVWCLRGRCYPLRVGRESVLPSETLRDR